MTKNKTKITLDQWHEIYLEPFTSDERLQEAINAYGGFAGWVLDGVLSIKDVEGEHANDHECLEVLSLLLDEYHDAVKRGIDTE